MGKGRRKGWKKARLKKASTASEFPSPTLENVMPPAPAKPKSVPEKWYKRIAGRFLSLCSSFWDSTLYIAQAIWTWPAIGTVSVFLYGYGIDAMYGNDFITATLCYFVAVVFLTAKALTWKKISRRDDRRVAGTVIVVVAAAVLGFSLYMVHRRSVSAAAMEKSKPVQPPVSEQQRKEPISPFRVVIDYMRGEVGMYGQRTLFMAYYLLDKIPTLSPIDLTMRVKIINLNPSTPAKIEAWSVETGPTDDGPWTKLLHVPSSPYTNIYVVGSSPQKTARFIMNDLGHILDVQPIEQKVEGWAMFECPLPPACMQTFARIDLRDISGNDHYTLVNVIEQSRKDKQTDLTERVEVRVSKYQSPLNMEKVRILRPFPAYAYWVIPKDEKGIPQGFTPSGTQSPPVTHTKKVK